MLISSNRKEQPRSDNKSNRQSALLLAAVLMIGSASGGGGARHGDGKRLSGCVWSVLALDKKKSSFLAGFRGWIQAGAALLTNIHLPNFAKGVLYQGQGKTVCVPGLNCYSCPARRGACPDRRVSGCGRLVKNSGFPIILPASLIFVGGCCWGGLSAAFSARSAGCRNFCIKSLAQVLHQATEAAALSEVRRAAHHGGAAACACCQ